MKESDYKEAAKVIGCDVATVKAVALVESNGDGVNADGSPKTLFEGHWFHKFTNGRYTGKDIAIGVSYSKWTRKHYGRTQAEEKLRLDVAVKLNREAALKSASWGAFQIMGFNYDKCGFSNVQDFVNAMYKGEGEQLIVFAKYIKRVGLDDELRDKNWARFAYYYNGSGYAINKYDKKLKEAYEKFKK